MAAKKTQKTKEPRLRLTVCHALTNIYTTLLFTAFPLFLSNYYSAARRDKFWFYLIMTIVFGVSVGVVTIVNEVTKNSPHNRMLNTYRDPFKLTVTDIAFMAFVGVSLVSMLTSGRILHCFIGLSGTSSNGRNMGFLTILLLFVSYMIISRYFYYKKFVFYCMLGGMFLVTFVAILNFYYMDPLGIFEAYMGSDSYATVIKDFTSTIGNKNYLSALICVALPFSLGLAISTKDKVMEIIAFISTGIQFMGLLIATSDGGFLGCFVAIAVMAVVVAKDAEKLYRFCVGVAVMLISAKVLWLFDLIMKQKSKGYTSFSGLFVYENAVFYVLIAFVALSALMYFIKSKTKDNKLPPVVFYALLTLVSLAALAVVGGIVYYSVVDTTTPLTDFRRFLRFDESWGTHRGYFWIKSFEVFGDMNVWQKLFGAGPESFYFKFTPYFSEMVTKFAESSTNSAHNVYINYLVTHGIVGLGAYLVFVISAIVSGIKNAKTNPLALTCIAVIIAYAAQDIVNIANPVNTPWFIAFIALSGSCALRANSAEHLAETNY